MNQKHTDIAVVGISCRFPDADDYLSFWENIISRKNSIKEIPSDRWDIKDYYSPDVNETGKSNSKWCGLLDGVYDFDHQFFSISPREASSMDPQHRLLLEETWHCIEDSGIPLRALQERVTSVYAGIMSADYLQQMSEGNRAVDSYACLGTYESLLANRISYTFNLRGVSMPINGACASSLVAIHEARRALVQGDCDYAFAAGVNLNLHPLKYVSFSKSRMLSPDGQCKTFDKDANGYVPGDGVGVLLLQRLDQAMEEGNRIYGIIKGSAVNHVGKSSSITAPSVKAQRDVILRAYKDADIRPETVTYIEAHGTGTSLGDPIEVEALTQAFREFTDDCGFCKIGSVKTNIGHLESAAGIAGVIKVLMMMKHQKIPATLNVKTKNPIIDFNSTPFEVATTIFEWRSRDEGQPLRAGVSSFGFGGANAHVLVEQYVDVPIEKNNPLSVSRSTVAVDEVRLFLLSAKNGESLNQLMDDWKKWMESETFKNSTLDDITRTLLMARESFKYRFGALVKSKQDVRLLLENSPDILRAAEHSWYLNLEQPEWQGYQDIDWGSTEKSLLEGKEEQIRKALEDLGIDNDVMCSFYDDVWDDEQRDLYVFTAGYAYAAALLELGFSPAFLTGSKAGGWICLAVSGMLSLVDIVAVLTGVKDLDDVRLQRPSIPIYVSDGQMLMPFSFDEAYVKKLVFALQRIADNEYDDVHAHLFGKARELYANQHTFKNFMDEWHMVIQTVTGANSREWLDDGGVEKKRLLLLMIVSSLRKLNQKWDLKEQQLFDQLPFYELLDLLADDVITKETAVQLASEDGLDLQAVAAMMNDRWRKMKLDRPYSVLREHGNEWNDAQLVRNVVHRSKTLVQPEAGPDIACLKLDRPFLENVMLLWLSGADLQMHKLNSGIKYSKLRLPLYAFWRNTFRLSKKTESQEVENHAKDASMVHPLLHRNTSDKQRLQFSSVFNGQEFFLADHQVNGSRVLPGVAYLELAGEAVRQVGGMLAQAQDGFILKHVCWMSPIRVDKEAVQVHIALHPDNNGDIRYEIYKETSEGNGTVVCGSGKANWLTALGDDHFDIHVVRAQCSEHFLNAKDCYRRLGKMGLMYGPGHQGIEKMYGGATQALAKLSLPACVWDTRDQYRLHPSMLDSALQGAILFAQAQAEEGMTTLTPLLPFALEKLELIRPCSPKMWAHIRYSAGSSRGDKVEYLDIDLCNESGEICVKIKRFTARALAGELAQQQDTDNILTELPAEAVLLTPVWDVFPLESDCAPESFRGRMVVIGGSRDELIEIQNRYPGATALEISASPTENEMMDMLEAGGTLDHILWIAPSASYKNPTSEFSIESVIDGQHQGVIQLFRIVKSLLRLGYGSRPLQLTVITVQTQYVYKSDPVDPIHASVHGFIGSLAKEYAGWGIRLVDLEADSSCPWDELFSLPVNTADHTFVYRNRQWHRRELVEVRCPKPNDSLYKRGGVYVVIGGAGGLGAAWSEYMIRMYQARIIWIGRRVKDAEIETRIQRCARYGLSPEYIRADAANREDLGHAFQTIKERFSKIDGVIHAAIDLLDSSVMKMDQSRFQTGLSAKVDVCISIAHVFWQENLDFVLFFSSINSFATPAGQSNYAAGCTFKDAFAHWLAHTQTYTVKVMNWGYWGSIGTVASDVYRTRMMKQGIGSVEHPEAMLALEMLLEGPMHQLGLIKTIGSRDVYRVNRRELITVLR
ncbi:SDR family NAD(P)-dependent oxidoreductase [Brevibacillus sp. NPDC003359]|uniref:SDR family NAD(P)-dependent oxidoreductase n=1 Tax=unclassified Brevibacillus TaxID=2684853 RepID=UPI0036A2E653